MIGYEIVNFDQDFIGPILGSKKRMSITLTFCRQLLICKPVQYLPVPFKEPQEIVLLHTWCSQRLLKS